jgi:hypothetical protein
VRWDDAKMGFAELWFWSVDEGMVLSAAPSSCVRDRGSITVGLVFWDGRLERMAKILHADYTYHKISITTMLTHQNKNRRCAIAFQAPL